MNKYEKLPWYIRPIVSIAIIAVSILWSIIWIYNPRKCAELIKQTGEDLLNE